MNDRHPHTYVLGTDGIVRHRMEIRESLRGVGVEEKDLDDAVEGVQKIMEVGAMAEIPDLEAIARTVWPRLYDPPPVIITEDPWLPPDAMIIGDFTTTEAKVEREDGSMVGWLREDHLLRGEN